MSRAHQGYSESFKKKKEARLRRKPDRAVLRKAKELYYNKHDKFDADTYRREVKRMKNIVREDLEKGKYELDLSD